MANYIIINRFSNGTNIADLKIYLVVIDSFLRLWLSPLSSIPCSNLCAEHSKCILT